VWPSTSIGSSNGRVPRPLTRDLPQLKSGASHARRSRRRLPWMKTRRCKEGSSRSPIILAFWNVVNVRKTVLILNQK
jgi:hypothetical protein